VSHWSDFLDPNGPNGAFLPWKKVEPRVGISRTTAWRLQQAGDFPKPYVVSPGRVAYRESEVEAWKMSRSHRSASMATPRRTVSASTAPRVTTPSEPPSWSAHQPSEPAKPLARTEPRSKPSAEPTSSQGRVRDRRTGGEQMKLEF
jgi:predicted DNA-binding transcriptional regulator AlpA